MGWKGRVCGAVIGLAVDPPPHFAGIALQGAFDQSAARQFWDQLDHIFPNALMFTTSGIAEADDFDRLFLFENNVLAAAPGGINPFGPKHLRGGLRAASGEEDQEDEAFHYPNLAGFG